MATVALQRDRSLHGGLGGALAPRDRGDGRDRREVAELDTFDARGELICDQLTCGRFASAAGARHEQEHPDSGAYPGLWPRSASSAPPELEDDDRIRQRASARRTIGMATKGWSGPPGRRKQVSDLTSRERRRCARNVTVGGSFGASGARLPGTCGCSTPEAAARFSTAPLVDRQRWLPSLDLPWRRAATWGTAGLLIALAVAVAVVAIPHDVPWARGPDGGAAGHARDDGETLVAPAERSRGPLAIVARD